MCSETITVYSLMSNRFGFVNMSEESSISLTLVLTCIISNCGSLIQSPWFAFKKTL